MIFNTSLSSVVPDRGSERGLEYHPTVYWSSKQGLDPLISFISAQSVLNLTSVPMALGKYLFSFRTQKSSSAAAIILPQVGN